MTPETKLFLDKAHQALAKADGMLAQWPDEAGRMAYLAGFHAAQALISEKTGKSAKTHRGVQAELHRLTKDDPRLDAVLRAFLGSTYTMKAVADYGTDPETEVSAAQAGEAIQTARRFVSHFEAVLSMSLPLDRDSGNVPEK